MLELHPEAAQHRNYVSKIANFIRTIRKSGGRENTTRRNESEEGHHETEEREKEREGTRRVT